MINDAICSLPVLTEKSTFSANSCKGLLYSYIYFYRLSQRVKKFLYMSHGHVILHGVSHEKYQTEGTIKNSEKLCTLWRFSWGYHLHSLTHHTFYFRGWWCRDIFPAIGLNHVTSESYEYPEVVRKFRQK